MKSAVAGNELSVEMADLIDKLIIHKFDEHVHRSLTDLEHINVHRGKGWTNDRRVLGTNKRHNLDVFWDAEAAVDRGIFDRGSDGVAIGDEEAFWFLLEVFSEVVVGTGVGIIAVDDGIGLANFLVGLDESLLAFG